MKWHERYLAEVMPALALAGTCGLIAFLYGTFKCLTDSWRENWRTAAGGAACLALPFLVITLVYVVKTIVDVAKIKRQERHRGP